MELRLICTVSPTVNHFLVRAETQSIEKMLAGQAPKVESVDPDYELSLEEATQLTADCLESAKRGMNYQYPQDSMRFSLGQLQALLTYITAYPKLTAEVNELLTTLTGLVEINI